MCTLKLPIGVINNLDRARRDYLWRASDVNDRRRPLVTLKKICRPKNKGGLGVINIISQNNALLLKHLDKFYNRKEFPG
jgi:hypothetical protein